MIQLNDLYDYGLKIYQNSDYFKFSLDSILLGEFVKIKEGNTVLDLCTGNAPIPMILSTKCSNILIDAIELQKEIYDLAEESIKINNLTSKITVIHADAKNVILDKKYDIVVCNPPYFKVANNSMKSENIIKRIARHEIEFTLENAVESAKKYLKENGTFYLVHRTERFLDTIKTLEEYKFGIRDVAFIFTKDGREAEFFLIEASKCKKSDIKIKNYNIDNLKTYKNIFKEGSS